MTRKNTKARTEAHATATTGASAPGARGDAKRALQANVDRLMAALDRRKLGVRRAAAIEILSEALGHRNSNETTRAVAEGALAPSTLTAIGRIPLPGGGEIAVGIDGEGRVLGVSPDLQATDRYVPWPYGGVVDLAGLAGAKAMGATATACEFRVEHADGDRRFVAATADEAFDALADWCRANWGEAGPGTAVPVGSEDVVDAFFDGNETYSYVEIEPVATAGAAPPATGRAVLRRPTRTVATTRIERGGEVLFRASGTGREEAIARWCRDAGEAPRDLPIEPDACLAAYLDANPTLTARTTTREVPCDLTPGAPGTVEVHWATIDHRHGLNHYIGDSEADVTRQLAEFAREWWHEVEGGDGDDDRDEAQPRASAGDPDEIGDDEIVDRYFEMTTDSEQLDRGTTTLWAADWGIPRPAAPKPLPGRNLHVHTITDHRGDGRDFQGFDEATAKSRLANWCRTNWSEGRAWERRAPLDDDAAIRAFVGDGDRHAWTSREFVLDETAPVRGVGEPTAGGGIWDGLDDVEWDLVLAAQRLVQQQGLSGMLRDIAENGRDGIPDDDEIDDVCERINMRDGGKEERADDAGDGGDGPTDEAVRSEATGVTGEPRPDAVDRLVAALRDLRGAHPDGAGIRLSVEHRGGIATGTIDEVLAALDAGATATSSAG